jgi:SAM-dependent methyltransferase
MFTKSAKFYDALYHFKDYYEAADKLHNLVTQLNSTAGTLLDVACGTGKHIEYLKKYYQPEGIDLNEELLEIAHERCPGIPFHNKNMIDFNLNKKFDIVACFFSSIAYAKTVENLEKTVACMTNHLNPGGVIIIEPWISPQKYWKGKITANFVDEPELKIAWMYTSEIEGTVSIFDINYLVGTPQGVKYFTERHEMGLFTHEEYLEALQKSGIKAQYDPQGLFGRGMYIGVKS